MGKRSNPVTPEQNHLLAALSAEVRTRLVPHLERVPMALGMVLYEMGDTLCHVYFPTDSIVSLHYAIRARFRLPGPVTWWLIPMRDAFSFAILGVGFFYRQVRWQANKYQVRPN